MIAKEVYKILRSVVGPWCKAHGFKPAKSSYVTYVGHGDGAGLLLCFQCHHQGWEKHKGSKFTVWLQRGGGAELQPQASNRLTSSLSAQDLEFVRARQNRIISSIPQPPAEYVNDVVKGMERAFNDPAPMIAIYLADWQAVEAPYKPTDDIWFRYFTEEDVRAWALVLLKYVESRVAKGAL